MLQTERLTKIYPGGRKETPVRALDGLNLELGPGLYGLLGPNGAGKSTLIHILTDSLAPTEGRVLWNGRPIQRLGRSYRRVLGYMPQQQTLYDGFTGLRFLQYMAALKEIAPKQVSEEIQRTAQLVNLTDQLDKRLVAYSGGMKQRLLAAAALLGNPQLLILDEPSAGLDPKERVRLRSALATYSRQAVVLVATHVVSDVESVADGILLLKQGRVVDRGTPAELEAKYAPGQGLEGVYLALFGEE